MDLALPPPVCSSSGSQPGRFPLPWGPDLHGDPHPSQFAPIPRVLPAAKVSTYCWEVVRAVYDIHPSIHAWPHIQSHGALSVSISSLTLLRGWRPTSGNIYVEIYVQGGPLQQPSLGAQSAQSLPLDPSLPSCWHQNTPSLEAVAPLQLLGQVYPTPSLGSPRAQPGALFPSPKFPRRAPCHPQMLFTCSPQPVPPQPRAGKVTFRRGEGASGGL